MCGCGGESPSKCHPPVACVFLLLSASLTTLVLPCATDDSTSEHPQVHATITNTCSNPEFPQEHEKNYLAWRNLMRTCLHSPMIWKVMPRNVWSGIANWPIKQLSNFSRFRLHDLMTNNSRRKNWDPWENCQKFVFKFS